MSDISIDKFASPDFDPEKYVKEMARTFIGGEELLQQKRRIKAVGDETAMSLKKKVYQNHMQFIDTASEISHLEEEMYKLSHLLSDQRSVLNTLSHTLILANENSMSSNEPDEADQTELEREEEQRKLKLNNIMEKVENCVNLLDNPTRTLLHEGDIVEIDPEENTAQKSRLHAFLFSDCLMISVWNANRRGIMRYRYEAIYPISTLAVVNVRDHDHVKQAIKLLAFPDTRVFQCNNSSSKKDWLEKFDQAKKSYLEKESAKTHTDTKEVKKHELPKKSSLEVEKTPDLQVIELPEWLESVSEELDVLIVERHFKEAYDLMIKSLKAIQSDEFKDHPSNSELLNKVETKKKTLIDILMKELSDDVDWSPRGGLRFVRQAISILNKFNMTSQACDMFLSICSHTIKTHTKGVQLEGSITTYVKQVGEVFFCSLSDAQFEFQYLFPKNKLSAFIVWAGSELRSLMSQIIKQLFTPQTSLESISECAESLRNQVNLFCEFGLDLRFQLDTSLRVPIMKALKEYKEKTIDLIKSKMTEDKWTPVNLHTKVAVNKFLNQMEMLGLDLTKYIINETWLDISSSTIWFAQAIILMQKTGLKLVTRDMMDKLDGCIFSIFNARLNIAPTDSPYIQKNYKFLLEVLLPFLISSYRETTGFDNEKLLALARKYDVKMATPKKHPSNIKYTATEYL